MERDERHDQETGAYLISIGIKKGDKVAIFAANRYEWWVADQAILAVGAVNVPIYATNSAEEALYMIDNSESKVCIVGTEDHLNRVLKVKSKLKRVKNIIIIDDLDKKKPGVVTLAEALKKGEAYKNRRPSTSGSTRSDRKSWPPSSTPRAPRETPRASC